MRAIQSSSPGLGKHLFNHATTQLIALFFEQYLVQYIIFKEETSEILILLSEEVGFHYYVLCLATHDILHAWPVRKTCVYAMAVHKTMCKCILKDQIKEHGSNSGARFFY